MIITLAKHEY